MPVELTSFVGREREVAELRQWLGSSRLLTLTGAGGSGKTRLAAEVVRRPAVENGFEAVAWVELSVVTNPALITQRIADACGFAEEVSAGDTALLIRLFDDRALLLVLDNCEHLVDAVAALADTLLRSCPRLRILATSREALGVKGERAWLVPALSVPASAASTIAELGEAESVRLFVERARDVVGEYALTAQNASAIAEICRRLDGIPLAIELAAARVRLLTPDQIRERLDDAFRLLKSPARTSIPRHRTLAAAIDWSHALLPAAERQLFRKLAVFRGGFTLEAVEAVGTNNETDADTVLDLLGRLVDRSLVVVREQGTATRYALLETVGQYARQRLTESGETDVVRARHAQHIERVIAEAAPHWIRPERGPWIERLLPDLENVREALAWSQQSDRALHVRIVGMLWWFWFSTRHWTEARQWIDRALDLPEAAEATRVRARLLFATGALAALQARETARAQLEEAERLAHALGDEQLASYALNYQAMAWNGVGDPRGLALAERAAHWFEQNGDLYGLRLALLLSAHSALTQGDLARAKSFADQGLRAARSFGADRELSIALSTMATVELERGELARAEALLLESLAGSRRDPSYFSIALALDTLGHVVGRRGRPLEAARIFAAAENVRSTIGMSHFASHRDRLARALPAFRAAAGEAGFETAWAAGSQLTAEAIIDELLAATPAAAPPAPAPTVAVAGADLRVQALGSFEVALDGNPLPEETWTYAKPKELLVYLLCQPRGASRDQLSLALWPAATPSQRKNSFHVTMHHLRKILGHPEWIALSGDRYALTPGLRYLFDADQFEAEARALLKFGGPLERMRAVLDLYRGDLLEHETVGAWIDEPRDRLRRLHVDLTLSLGDALEQSGQMAAAAELYQRIAARDDLLEEAHRRLMVHWARSGERTRALRHYERVVEVLRDVLDAEPEPETVDLYERIRTAQPV